MKTINDDRFLSAKAGEEPDLILEDCLVGATVEPADELVEVNEPIIVIVHVVQQDLA